MAEEQYKKLEESYFLYICTLDAHLCAPLREVYLTPVTCKDEKGVALFLEAIFGVVGATFADNICRQHLLTTFAVFGSMLNQPIILRHAY